MVAVEVRAVSKKFGDTPVLSGISLSVERGETFFIMGASGSGKTTLLRLISGLEIPDSGVVLFDGVDVTSLPVDVRGASFVFQNYCLWPHMSVAENISFGLEMRSISIEERRARVLEVCRLTQLRGLENRYPHELSGGQQQRVALARAIAVQPRVLLLDEPLSNLDHHLRSSIRRELKDLGAQLGMTMIYVSHDFDDALNLADRVAILERGVIAQCGTPKEIYEHPLKESVGQFLGPLIEVPSSLHRSIGSWYTRPEWVSIGVGERGAITEFEFRDGGASATIQLEDNTVVRAMVPLHLWNYSVGDSILISVPQDKLLSFNSGA